MTTQTPLGGFRLLPITQDGLPQTLSQPAPDDLAVMIAATVEFYARAGFTPPWISYLSVDGSDVVGGGAFVGAPADGEVEIAYFTLPAWQHRGYALRTAQALVATARSHDPGIVLWAKTLPESGASTRVLERLGFRRTGIVTDEEIGNAWRWTKTR